MRVLSLDPKLVLTSQFYLAGHWKWHHSYILSFTGSEFVTRHKGYISSQLPINAGLTVSRVDPYFKGLTQPLEISRASGFEPQAH